MQVWGRNKLLCGRVGIDYFGRKRATFFQSAALYLRFSESKRRAKDFRGSDAAAKAWLRGGFRLPQQTAPPKTQKLSFCTVHKAVMRNRRATGARMGLVSKQNLFISVSTLMPCHVTVCVNCVSGSNVQFLCVIIQSTGLTFPTGSLTRDDYG